MLDPHLELADLHIHVGAAVAPHILWSIAHDQGFKLPVQTYWEFRDLVTAKPENARQEQDVSFRKVNFGEQPSSATMVR